MAATDDQNGPGAADAKELSARVEALLEEVAAQSPPDLAERVDELVGALVGLYGAGLDRVLTLLSARPDGEQTVRELAADEFVGNLLLLHDLHPDDVDTRVQKALDDVRPYLGSHAGGVDYLGIDDEGVVRLRLEGSCSGCPSSTVTVQLTIEQAVLEAAPEATRVEVDGMVEEQPPGPPLLQILPHPPGRHREPGPALSGNGVASDGWQHLDLALVDGSVERVEVAGLDLIVCTLGGTPYAYGNVCPPCGSRLHTAALSGESLRCGTCGTTYDVRLAGKASADRPGMYLDPLPLLPDGSGWKLAVPGRVSA